MIEKYTNKPVKYQEVGSVQYAYFEEGEGPLVVLLHGFPDNALAYLETIDFLVLRKYKVLAPFLLGYYPSDVANDEDYSVFRIANDILKLVELTNGKEPFYLVGHDWGASIAYAMTNIQTEHIKKLVTVAIPHPRAIKPSLGLLMKARHFILFYFKNYGLWYARKNNLAYINYLYRYWAPNWHHNEEHIEMIKETFKMDGRLEAALGYYWSFYKDAQNKERQKLYAHKTEVPALVFAGESDGAIQLETFKDMRYAFLAPLEVVVVPKAGHFIHQETPDLFNSKIFEFFQI